MFRLHGSRVGRHVLEVLLGEFTKLAFGYAGETGVLEAWMCFSFGMGSWWCAGS